MPPSVFPRSRTVRVPVDNEQVAIRQVQVTNRARPLIGRFVITVLITYCVANTLSALASDDFKKRSEQARSQMEEMRKGQDKARQPTDHWKRQHEALSRPPSSSSHTRSPSADADDSQIMHLTLPVWFRERRRRIQTPQDREWQDFKDLMLDENQVVEVQKKTAHVVLHICHHRSDLKPWLRWIEYTGRTGVRFDIAPQIFSPTVYEVPCVFVKPNQVELGWRALSPASGARIERIFHPVVFASAFYAGLHAFASKSFAITAAKLNKAFSAPSELLRVEVHAQMPEADKAAASQQQQQQQQQKQQQQQAAGQTTPAVTSKTAGLMLPSHHTLSWKAHMARAQSMTYTEALTAARQVFKAVWMMKQSAAMQAQTPGLCMMKGVVTLEGRRGRIRLDVTAYYSPSTKSLVGLPVITSHLVIPDPETWDAADAKQNAAAMLSTRQAGRPLPSLPGKESQSTPSSTTTTTTPPQPPPERQPPRPPDKDAGK